MKSPIQHYCEIMSGMGFLHKYKLLIYHTTLSHLLQHIDQLLYISHCICRRIKSTFFIHIFQIILNCRPLPVPFISTAAMSLPSAMGLLGCSTSRTQTGNSWLRARQLPALLPLKSVSPAKNGSCPSLIATKQPRTAPRLANTVFTVNMPSLMVDWLRAKIHFQSAPLRSN